MVLTFVLASACASSDDGRERAGGKTENVRLFSTDFSKAADTDGDVQVCDDNFFDAAEIQLPSQKGLKVASLKKTIETACTGIAVDASELVSPSDSILRQASVFTIDLGDGC